MEIQNRKHTGLVAGCVVALLGASPAAIAGPAEDAIGACKVAIADEQGSEMLAKLKRIKSRGNTYETWFNLSNGDEQVKAYCVAKRNTVEEVILADGRWTRRNPSRPEPVQAS